MSEGLLETNIIPYEIMLEKPMDECGVYGVYAPGLPVAHMARKGLFALQHRGQEAAGVASSNGEDITLYKDIGKVQAALGADGQYLADQSSPDYYIAVAQTRYGTVRYEDEVTEDVKLARQRRAAQPMFRNADPESLIDKQFTLSVNGHVEDLTELAIEYDLDTTDAVSDTEVMGDVLAAAYRRHDRIEDAMLEVLPKFKGAFSLLVSTPDALIAARDPHGTRPLQIGYVGSKGIVVASEIAALDRTGAIFDREVAPGEMLSIRGLDSESICSRWFYPEPVDTAVCPLEYVYMSRPEQIIEGQSVYDTRIELGRLMAEDDDVEADAVVGVPESGLLAADGYAWGKGLRHEHWIVKNMYSDRSFIAPNQQLRAQTVREKLNPISHKIAGQRLIIVDDSHFRGTTMIELVKMLREAGAAEVHARFTFPKVINSCHSGVDIGNTKELIAAYLTDEELCEFYDLDSIKFASVELLQQAVGKAAGKICLGCTTGVYPSEISVPVPVYFRLKDDVVHA